MKKQHLYLVSLGISLLIPYLLILFIPGKENTLAGIDIRFLFLVLTLLMVSLFHHYTLPTALAGLASVLVYSLFISHVPLLEHLDHEKIILVNLFGLLMGFALLAKHFEESGFPDWIASRLPDNWTGPFVLLVCVFILSSFLDNIAASMIGGTIALVVFNKRVHIGYIAAIVAASNAGGSGSVVGDTTTTMMWIEGVPAIKVLPGYMAAVPALLFFSYFASRQQVRLQPVISVKREGIRISGRKIIAVALILAGTILANILFGLPAAGVWAAIFAAGLFTSTPWKELKVAVRGSTFLVSLVLIASLMPVEELPAASWETALGLGFVSSVFDNIPLTKIAISQNGYDWGMLAYAVGFGGSMIWFGSSAGVAISGIYPEAKSVLHWLFRGWHILVAYILGFFILLLLLGWNPFMIPA